MMHSSRRVTLRNRKFLRKIDNQIMRFTHLKTLATFQSRQCLEEEEEEEAPRAGNSRPQGRVAGPGSNTKVRRRFDTKTSLTNNDPSHLNPQPGAGSMTKPDVDANIAEEEDTANRFDQGHFDKQMN